MKWRMGRGEIIVAGEHVCHGYFNNRAFARAKLEDMTVRFGIEPAILVASMKKDICG